MAVTPNSVSFLKLFAVFASLVTISQTCYSVFSSTASKNKQSGIFKEISDEEWSTMKSMEIIPDNARNPMLSGNYPRRETPEISEVNKAYSELIASLQKFYKVLVNAPNLECIALIMLLVGFVFVHVLSFTFQLIRGQGYPKSKIMDIVILVVGALCVVIGAILLVYAGSTVCSRKNFEDLDQKLTKFDTTYKTLINKTKRDEEDRDFTGYIKHKKRDWYQRAGIDNEDLRRQFKESSPIGTVVSDNKTSDSIDIDASVKACKDVYNTSNVIISGVIGFLTLIVFIVTIVFVGLLKGPVTIRKEPESSVEMEVQPPQQPESEMTLTTQPPPDGQVEGDSSTQPASATPQQDPPAQKANSI